MARWWPTPRKLHRRRGRDQNLCNHAPSAESRTPSSSGVGNQVLCATIPNILIVSVTAAVAIFNDCERGADDESQPWTACGSWVHDGCRRRSGSGTAAAPTHSVRGRLPQPRRDRAGITRSPHDDSEPVTVGGQSWRGVVDRFGAVACNELIDYISSTYLLPNYLLMHT